MCCRPFDRWLTALILDNQQTTTAQSGYVETAVSSTINPKAISSNVVNYIGTTVVGGVLGDGDPTGKASLAGAIGGWVAAGSQGFVAGAAAP